MSRLDAAIDWANAQPKFFVYAITDGAGSVVYVGATQNPAQRWRSHTDPKATHQRPLRGWITENEHAFEVLDTYPNKRLMLDAEQQYIRYIKPRFNHT